MGGCHFRESLYLALNRNDENIRRRKSQAVLFYCCTLYYGNCPVLLSEIFPAFISGSCYILRTHAEDHETHAGTKMETGYSCLVADVNYFLNDPAAGFCFCKC